MAMAEVVVKSWGNSLGIVLPKELTKHENIKSGDRIKIDIIVKKGLEGFGLLKGLGSYVEDTEHEEFA